VHGVRHRLRQDPAVEPALAALHVDQELDVVEEPDNPVDPQAMLVTRRGGPSLGWIPSVLLPYVHEVTATGPSRVRVVRANGPEVPPGYRLLVGLDGHVRPGYRAFDGPDWALRAP